MALFTGLNGAKLKTHARDLALSDLAAVSTWADSSGNGNDLTQGTGSLQPRFNTNNALFGGPGVEFGAGSVRKILTADNTGGVILPLTNSETEIFVAYARNEATITDINEAALLSDGNDNFGGLLPHTNGNWYESWGCFTRFNTTLWEIFNLNELHIFNMRSRVSGNYENVMRIYHNNEIKAQAVADVGYAVGATFLFGGISDVNYRMEGVIKDIVIFQTWRTEAQRKDIVKYLSSVQRLSTMTPVVNGGSSELRDPANLLIDSQTWKAEYFTSAANLRANIAAGPVFDLVTDANGLPTGNYDSAEADAAQVWVRAYHPTQGPEENNIIFKATLDHI